MRVLKYLRGHIPAVALIVLLLAAQSFCELSLPAYTSRIVDTGIQQGGIESPLPETIRQSTLDALTLLMSEEDADALQNAYGYYLQDDGVLKLRTDLTDDERTALEDAWGNPSALYRPGQQARKLVEDARRTVARVLHAARPAEITFTSGGTESDVQALYTGAALGAAAGKRHIISTQIEHHAVLHTLQALQAQGFTVTLLPPSAAGLITPQQLADALQPDTCLVSIMFANNEIGTVQPIAELGALCREHSVLFHTDAVQAAGHLAIDVQTTNIDLLSLSGHKFHGPKGAGALYTRRGIALQNVLYGGGQERSHRAGTENVPAIAGLAAALAQADANLPANTARCLDLRQRLTERLLAIPGTHLNGDAAQRLPGNVNITFDGVEAETLLLLLDEAGICASAGSACSAGAVEPSHVLLALGLTPAQAKSTLRLTLDAANTAEEIDTAAAVITACVQRLRDGVR